jgi:hypothetical protein
VFFAGTWKTQGGSTYEWKNNEMICISVNDDKFKGWVNNVALRNFRQEGERWYADQAIRYHYTGKLSEWATAEIEIKNKDSFIKTVQKANVEKTSCCEPQLWQRIKQ